MSRKPRGEIMDNMPSRPQPRFAIVELAKVMRPNMAPADVTLRIDAETGKTCVLVQGNDARSYTWVEVKEPAPPAVAP
jgi:hypothetical protein